MRQGVPLTVEGNGKCVYFLACGGLIYRTAMPCHTCSTFRKMLWVLPRANPLHRIETISGQNAAVVAVPALTLSSQRLIIPATDAANHGSATLLNLAMKICFDTSALVAALLQKHPLHALAFPHLQAVRAGQTQGYLTTQALAELFAALTALGVGVRASSRSAVPLISKL